jgi:hypothetical protein
MILGGRPFRSFAPLVFLAVFGVFTAHAQVQFEQWRTTVFTPTEANDDGVGGLLADPDGDGLKNVQEYAFTGSAKFPDPLILPSVSINLDHLTVSFVRPKYTPDLTYVAEVSTDLMTWYSGSTYTQQIAIFDRGDVEAVVIQDNLSLLSEARRFMRIRVTYATVDTGLVLWLDAGAGVTKDGSDKVTAWEDRSGLLNHTAATGAGTGPTWIDNVINGRPVLRFDGVDDLLTAPSQITNDNFTLFAVIKATNTHEVDTESATGTAGSSGQKYLFGAQSWSPDSGAGLSVGTNGLAAYEQASSYMPPLAVHSGTVGSSASLVALRYLNKQPSLYLKGELIRVGLTSPKAAVWAPSQIGSGDFGAFQGDVAEVMLYNRTLSTEEIARVDTYLSKKYGLQINPVVAITSPSEEIEFGSERVDVKGTISNALQLSSLLVNGVEAHVSGNDFVARNVGLRSGLNVLTAIAKDVSGHIGATSVNLIVPTTSPVDPVTVTTDVTSGFGPLSVEFDITSNIPGTILEVWYDFDGDGIVDQVAYDLNNLSHIYSSEGNYIPIVTLVTTLGNYSTVGGHSNEESAIIVRPAPTVTTSLTSISAPVDLKVAEDGSLYVLAQGSSTVIQFDATGTVIRTSAALGGAPTGLEVDEDGRVYVALKTLHQVVRLVPDGITFALDTSFNGTGKIGRSDTASGSEPGEFNQPYDVAVDGDSVYVTDTGNNRLQVFGLNGAFKEAFGGYGTDLGQFSAPKGVTRGADTNLYVTDSGNNRIVLISGSDSLLRIPGSLIGTSAGDVRNLSADRNGLYLLDSTNTQIWAVAPPATSTGDATVIWALDDSYGLLNPQSLASAYSLTSQVLFVADTGNDRVLKIQIAPQSPLTVWSGFKTKINAGSIESALSDCYVESRPAFREIISRTGAAEFYSWLTAIGTLTPVNLSQTNAKYSFAEDIDGTMVTFTIEFINVGGKWKILSF